jgi:addiction module HigA family antidote
MVRKPQTLFTPKTPGEVLKTYVLKAGGPTQDQLAQALNVSRLSVNQLLNGKRSVTAEMALRLSQVLGTTPDFWLNLQRDVDLFDARQKLDAELGRLTVLRKRNERADA